MKMLARRDCRVRRRTSNRYDPALPQDTDAPRPPPLLAVALGLLAAAPAWAASMVPGFAPLC